MGYLDQLFAGVDNTKRVVGRNVSDMVSDPRLYAEKIVGALRNQNAGVSPTIANGELTNRPLTMNERVENTVGQLDFGGGLGKIVYHGSPHKFNTVNVKSNSINNMGILGDVPTERHGAFFTDKPAFAKEYGDVTKWDIKPKKTVEINQQLRDDFLDSVDPFGPNRDVWLQAKFGAKQDWGLFEGRLGDEFTKFLKNKGYDAAKFKEYVPTKSGGEVGGTTTVLLNPERARKVTDDSSILSANTTPTIVEALREKK